MLWARATEAKAVRESAGAPMIATATGINKPAERVMAIERGTVSKKTKAGAGERCKRRWTLAMEGERETCGKEDQCQRR